MRSSRGAGVLPTVVAVLVVAAVVVGLRAPGTAWTMSVPLGAPRPPLPAGLSAHPVGTPEPAPPGEGGWSPLAVQPDGPRAGEPVAWDPCRPIPFVVNSDAAPPGAELLLAEGVAEVERLAGVRFVNEGPTDELPTAVREPFQPDRYGQRWAPVLVAWSDPTVAPDLAGVLGYAGPDPVPGEAAGTVRYVSGRVVLHGPSLGEYAAREAGLARARAVVVHELLHLLGLDHVDDHRSILHPSPTPLVVTPGDGDRRGLVALAGSPCFTDF